MSLSVFKEICHDFVTVFLVVFRFRVASDMQLSGRLIEERSMVGNNCGEDRYFPKGYSHVVKDLSRICSSLRSRTLTISGWKF